MQLIREGFVCRLGPDLTSSHALKHFDHVLANIVVPIAEID